MAAAKSKKYHFTTTLTPLDQSASYMGLIVPEEIIEAIGKKGRIRAKGTMNGMPFDLAIQHIKTGERYFMVSKALRRANRLTEGIPIHVEFSLSDPEQVDLPEELLAVLAQDDEGHAVWSKFTPGKQRSLAHYVNSVKNIDSRIKRALEIVGKAKRGELFLQKGKEE